MQEKRAIATYGVGGHAELLELSLPTFERYAALHGYDLHVVSCECDSRPPAWGKIPALRKLLETHDEVLWLDADVLIVSPEEDLASLVPEASLQALTVHVNKTRSVVPNTGVWLVRTGMLPYLAQAWEMTHHIHHPWWEQAAIIELMGYALRGIISAPPTTPNELYLRTFQLPAHWNAHLADTTSLASHPRIRHALGDCATKLRRMREWLAA
jgi:hypothetical protein